MCRTWETSLGLCNTHYYHHWRNRAKTTDDIIEHMVGLD